MEMTKFTQARQVRYDPRTDLIEPMEEDQVDWMRLQERADIAEAILDDFDSLGWRVIEPVQGWDDWTHLIMVGAVEDYPTFYLVK